MGDADKVGRRISQMTKAQMHTARDALMQACGCDECMGMMPDMEDKSTSEKSIQVPAYIKSLHLPYEEQFFKDVLAVKYVGKNEIQHYLVLWGDPSLVDLETEYFSRKGTDFWDKHLGFPRPLTWNHAQNRDVWKGSQIIGGTIEFQDDHIGRLAHSILKEHDEYRKLVDSLISQRVVGTSSDSAPQYVVREKTVNGKKWTKSGMADWECDGEFKSQVSGSATLLKEWPLFGSALTHIPCEPRMLDVGSPYWKTVYPDIESLKGRIAEVRQIEAERIDSVERLNIAIRRERELQLYAR